MPEKDLKKKDEITPKMAIAMAIVSFGLGCLLIMAITDGDKGYYEPSKMSDLASGVEFLVIDLDDAKKLTDKNHLLLFSVREKDVILLVASNEEKQKLGMGQKFIIDRNRVIKMIAD